MCQKVAETITITMEHIKISVTYTNVWKTRKITGGITGSETLMSENNEELMTIYKYMEIIFKTLTSFKECNYQK